MQKTKPEINPHARLVYFAVSETQAQAKSFDDAKKFFAGKGKIHLIAGEYLPNLGTVFHDFEKTLYPYGTAANELYDFCAFWWQGIAWTTASIPELDEKQAQGFFALRKLSFEASTFMAYTDNGRVPFPFRGPQFRLIS